MNHNETLNNFGKTNYQDSFLFSTGSKAFQLDCKLSDEDNIAKFVQSKYSAFDFVSDFETNCLNIIKPESLGFEDIEKLNYMFKREKETNKEETDTDYIFHKQSTKLTVNKTDTITISDEIYDDNSLSQAFNSCIDDE